MEEGEEEMEEGEGEEEEGEESLGSVTVETEDETFLGSAVVGEEGLDVSVTIVTTFL